MSDFPDEIFIGYLGTGQIWGEYTKDTHPRNPKYIRADITKEEAQAALMWVDTEPNAPKHFTKAGNENARRILKKLLKAAGAE